MSSWVCITWSADYLTIHIKYILRSAEHLLHPPPPAKGAVPSPWRRQNLCVNAEIQDRKPREKSEGTGVSVTSDRRRPSPPARIIKQQDHWMSSNTLELLNDKAEQNAVAPFKQNI